MSVFTFKPCRTFRRGRAIVTVLILGLAWGGEQSIGFAISPDELVRELQKRLDAIETVYCYIEYSTLWPAGSASDVGERRFPPEDWLVPTTNEAWLDWRDGRVRLEVGGKTIHGSLEKVVSQHEVRLFDGEQYQKFTPKEYYRDRTDSEAWVELHEHGTQRIYSMLDYGVLVLMSALGNLPVQGGTSARTPKVRLDPSFYKVVAQRGSLVVLRSGNLRQSNSPGHPAYYELELDMARDAAITRYIGHRMGYQHMTIDYRYGNRRGAAWIPSGWTETRYARDGTLAVSREAHSVSVELNADLTDMEFHMVASPGMFVYSLADDAEYYQLAPGTRITSEEGLRHIAQAQGRNRRMLRTFLTMLAVVGVAVSVGIWLRTHRRAGKDG